MSYALAILIALSLIGALSGPKTLAHAFAVGFDMFIQAIIWNDAGGITISSRAGIAARNGKVLGARIINFIMFNPNHCEQAILADVKRAQSALNLLQGK